MTKKINRFYSSVLNRIKRQYKDSTTLLVLRSRNGLSNMEIDNPCLIDVFTPYINECPEIKGVALSLFHKI